MESMQVLLLFFWKQVFTVISYLQGLHLIMGIDVSFAAYISQFFLTLGQSTQLWVSRT